MEAASPKELILRARQAADVQMNQILCADSLSEDFFQGHLRSYILHKFLLEESDCQTDDFQELIALSLSKSMHISKELVAEFDRAKTCDGATSAMAKRILLLMSIQKKLGIQLPADEAAAVKTLTQLTELVWRATAASPQWRHRCRFP